MKVIDIYREGQLLCSSHENEEYIIEKDEFDRVFFVNRTLSDLKLDCVSDINAEISADVKTVDALICGVAYYLAIKYCMNEKSAFLADMYNSKRAAALSRVSKIKCSNAFKQ